MLWYALYRFLKWFLTDFYTHKAKVTTVGPLNVLMVEGRLPLMPVVGHRAYHLEDLRQVEVISIPPSPLYPYTRAEYKFVFRNQEVFLPKKLGENAVQGLHELNISIPILHRDQWQQVGTAAVVYTEPEYDHAGWEQFLAAADELSPEMQTWVRTDLTPRQTPGLLLAAVVGNRLSPDLSIEPAALLVYAEVIIVTSGYGRGMTHFLRPGKNLVLGIVVNDEHLVEVESLSHHVFDLKPLAARPVALQALRSLPWIQLREQGPSAGTVSTRNVL